MDYRYFTVEDFVTDDYFRQWVKHPDGTSAQFWTTFLDRYPEQAETVRLAAEMVNQIIEATAALSDPADRTDEEVAIWKHISAQVQARAQANSPFVARHRGFTLRWLLAAASLVLVLGAGWWWQATIRSAGRSSTRQTAVVDKPPLFIERRNTGMQPLLVSLPDGSSILLHKGSHLRYPTKFSRDKRIVYLTGEAFFEVARDPAHPFFVHASGLVTKVLGTSFTIKAYSTDKNVVVTVRSGRVAVYAESDEQEQPTSSTALDGVVLTRNQQLVFMRHEARLTTPHVITPAIARSVFTVSSGSFQFEATPVSEVLTQLEKAYGLHVVYDKETLGKCRLTADLTDEPLADKLMIISKSIEATYTLTDSQLTITGPGCGS